MPLSVEDETLEDCETILLLEEDGNKVLDDARELAIRTSETDRKPFDFDVRLFGDCNGDDSSDTAGLEIDVRSLHRTL